MVFWIGILVGALFAFFAVKRGFYETWAILFNIIISIYLAVFLRPIIEDIVPAAGTAQHTSALILVATAVVCFLLLHGMAYVFFTSQFNVPFPKIFDVLGAGFLGFLAGFLVWSFAAFLISLSPASQNTFIKSIGLDSQAQQASISHFSWWCDLVNNVVSSRDDRVTTEQAISGLLKSAEAEERTRRVRPPKQKEPLKPAEPNDVGPGLGEVQLGPPPEPDVEDF